MKAVLIIQGEGRGHISQSISYIQNNPHLDIQRIIITSKIEKSENFLSSFGNIPITYLQSLNFKYKNGKVDFTKTLFSNLVKMPVFIKNVITVRNIIKKEKPSLVINFYEPLSVLSTFFTKTKKISVANQYLFYNKGWRYPSKNINYWSIKFWNNLTSFGSDEILAPSFINYPKNKKVKTIDPLIRKEIKKRIPRKKKYTLVYLIDDHIVDKFTEYAKRNTDKKFELFCDKNIDTSSNVNWNPLDPDKFVDKLVNCEKVIATAGFQLICESLYLNKDIEVIPIHYEQEINGYNLEAHNLGKISDLF